MEHDVRERINEILAKKNISINQLSKNIGVVQTTLNRQLNGFSKVSQSTINSILAYFNDVSPDWLIFGDGEMYKDGQNINYAELHSQPSSTLPLLPFEVIGGFPVGDNDGAMIEQCERYSVPDFVQRGAQFLVKVSGSSMYPKYSNGDILAVRRLEDVTFFQWGKVYVLDTSQGAIIKRVFPGEGNNIKCHSDNSNNYPDFDVSREDIRGVGIVVGCIRLE